MKNWLKPNVVKLEMSKGFTMDEFQNLITDLHEADKKRLFWFADGNLDIHQSSTSGEPVTITLNKDSYSK